MEGHVKNQAGDRAEEGLLSLKGHLVSKDEQDGTRVVTLKDAAIRTFQGLQKLRDNPSCCDVTFKFEAEEGEHYQVERRELHAHRCILMLHSSYFHAMFADGFKEGSSMNAVISPAPEVVDLTSAEALLDFMYTGKLTVTPETVQGMIMAAEHWNMAEVKTQCEELMGNNVSQANCFEVLQFAEDYRCPDLRHACERTIQQHFSELSKTEVFMNLSTSRLTEILSFDELNLNQIIDCEDDVVEALLGWIDFDRANRKDELPDLLEKCIRMCQTSRECRKKLLEKHPEVKGLTEKLMEKRTYRRGNVRSLYVIGGFGERQTSSIPPFMTNVERYGRPSKECANFPMEKASAVAAFRVHGRAFAVAIPQQQKGKKKPVAPGTGIFEYRPIQNEWLDAKPNFSPQALQSLDTCLHEEGAITVCPDTNTIYVVSHSLACSIAVDVLEDGDISGNEVNALPPFPAGTFADTQKSFCAVVLDRKLYLLGGAQGRVPPTASGLVLMYDPDKSLWESKAHLRQPRFKAGAVAFEGMIYVCGGLDGNSRLSSLEIYDPTQNTWIYGPSMQHARSHHQMVVYYYHLLAVGGKSYIEEWRNPNGPAETTTTNVESNYYKNTDKNCLGTNWRDHGSMKEARYGFAAVVI